MARRKKNRQEEPRTETRKETRIRARDRDRNRRVSLIVGGAIALALLFVIVGTVSELVIKPNSVLARVEDEAIVTRDFWERARLRQSELENQLLQLQLFSQQFGSAEFFTSQIAQIEATLASPLSLGTQVLNDMIEEKVVIKKAEELGVTVSDEAVEEALREEVAAGEGAVTIPQATATAEAGAEATAVAASFTPTPTPEIDAGAAITESETLTDGLSVDPAAEPTPEPPPILTDELYQEGLDRLREGLDERTGMSLTEYREFIRARLLREELTQFIGEQEVEAVEEAVNARHILISIDPEPVDESGEPGDETDGDAVDESGEDTTPVAEDPEDEPTEPDAEGSDSTPEPVEEGEGDSGEADTGEEATPEPVEEGEETGSDAGEDATSEPLEGEEVETPAEEEVVPAEDGEPSEGGAEEEESTPEVGEADTQTSDEVVEPDAEVEQDELVADTNGDGRVDEAEALAMAEAIRQLIFDGADFAEMAERYSDDPGSGAQGGDLGWAGRGRYVPEFEEAAFTQPVGVVGEPVKTQFGFHLIEVIERDTERAKEESQLDQEYAQAFQTWLQAQVQTFNIERPDDLPSRLPSDLGPSN